MPYKIFEGVFISEDVTKAVDKFNMLYNYIGMHCAFENPNTVRMYFYYLDTYYNSDKIFGMLLHILDKNLKVVPPIKNNGNIVGNYGIDMAEHLNTDSIHIPNYLLIIILKSFLDFLKTEISYEVSFLQTSAVTITHQLHLPIFKNILVKYTELLLSKEIPFGITQTPREVYKIIYDEVCDSNMAFKFMNGIEYNAPSLYKRFKQIGDPEKIKIAGEMGGLGF